MNIVLSDEQVNAIESVKKFISSSEDAFCIKGPAGTGKSLIEYYIIKYLRENHIRYCLAAPTHKAALVMEQYIGEEAVTLHSLLALSPKLDILELDFNDLNFNSGECKQIPPNGVVVCDEASMINDDLFKFLLKRCREMQTKLILLGDFKQLQPVKQQHYSKIINLKNSAELTKVFRQDEKSALVPLLIDLREHNIHSFDTDIRENGSVVCESNMKEFSEKFLSEFKRAISSSDILHTKIAAFTNNRVDKYNQAVHKLLFRDDKEYHKLGFLTCFENIERNCMKFWNSMDYVIIDEPEKIDIVIPNFGKLPGYKLRLYDSLNKQSACVNMLSNDISFDYFESLAEKIETMRLKAVKCKTKAKYIYWREYFKMMDSFCTPKDLYYNGRLVRKKSFDHGYACTIHKLQGSSINTMFVDMKDVIKQRNPEELRQLQYVALSRARKNVYIYQ